MQIKLREFKLSETRHGLMTYPSYDGAIGKCLEKFGEWSVGENIIMSNFISEGDTIIDVGANIGTTTLEASKKIGNDGKIFSFEPHPTIFKFLQGNILLNKCKNVELFNFAIGSKSTNIHFSDNYTDESNSVQEDNVGIEIKMKTLDEIIPKEVIKKLFPICDLLLEDLRTDKILIDRTGNTHGIKFKIIPPKMLITKI